MKHMLCNVLCFEVALCCLILYISLDITSFDIQRDIQLAIISQATWMNMIEWMTCIYPKWIKPGKKITPANMNQPHLVLWIVIK